MKKRILIIEDEEIITKSLTRFLSKEGFAVEVALGGEEALKKIKEKDIDLIICDIRMPNMDGIETIKAIRNYLISSGKKLIPEIVITGYADENKYRDAVELKVAGYIYKPFDTQEFLEVIKRNLA